MSEFQNVSESELQSIEGGFLFAPVGAIGAILCVGLGASAVLVAATAMVLILD